MIAILIAIISAIGALLAAGGVVFHSGRLTARVESLEQWRRELTAHLDQRFDRLEDLMRS